MSTGVLKKLEWDNLFNYGEKNSIIFENLNGIVGVFGKNFSGKSSIVDSLLYTLFNTTSKNNRKNLNIINQNKDYCRGYVEIDVGTKTYRIERVSTKYVKKLRGNVTQEAKTDLEFSVYDNALEEERSLNGTSRIETDKNIKKIFGSLEDFLLTSMASQLGSLSYIGEGSTRRKEILAKFLDLEVFERKFRMAKEEAGDMKALIRRDENRQFDDEILEAEKAFNKNNIKREQKDLQCNNLKKELQTKQDELQEISLKLNEIPDDIIDIKNLLDDISEAENHLLILNNIHQDTLSQIGEKEMYIEETKTFLEDIDIEDIKEKQKQIDDKIEELKELENHIANLEEKIKQQKKKISLLNEVPCGDAFPTCKFIQDAHKTKLSIENSYTLFEDFKINKTGVVDDISKLDPDKTQEYIKKYDYILQNFTEAKNKLNMLHLDLERNKNASFKVKTHLAELGKQREYYDQNKELIENLETLQASQEEIENEVAKLNKQHEHCQKLILKLYKENGTLEERVEKIKRDKEEYTTLRSNFFCL